MVERGRSPVVEREVYGEDDARSMSPRRNSEELEKIGKEAKATLEQWVPSPGSLHYHGIFFYGTLTTAFITFLGKPKPFSPVFWHY